MNFPRFKDLSERVQTVVTTLVCESVPLVTLTVATWALMNEHMVDNAEHSLITHVDLVSERVDNVNLLNIQQLHALRAQPHTRAYCSASAAERLGQQAEIRATLQTFVDTGKQIAVASVLSPAGIVWASTAPDFEDTDTSPRSFVARAKAGEETVSDVFRASPEGGSGLLVAYTAPMEDDRGAVRCILVITALAGVVDDILKAMNEFAGPDSFLDLLDGHGVRLSDSAHPDYVGHPAGPAPAGEVAEMVAEGRFRRETAALLADPIPDEELFELARSSGIQADAPVWGATPSTGKQGLIVARRISTAPWTLVARVPESAVLGPARELIRRELSLGVAAVLVAIGIGLLLVHLHQRRFQAMVAAADALAGGQLDARIPDPGKDEIGHVCTRFNEMAEVLQHSQATLEARVADRTRALADMNSKLEQHQVELIAQQEELRRQATELERRNAEVESAGQQKSELLLRMSSKLRTPLNSVIGYADLLLGAESGPLTAQQREFIEAIASAQREQLGLVTDTVDWSEMEAGHLKLAPEVLPVEGVLSTARDAIAPQATRKQINILTTCMASQPVFADARRVHQVLLHILSNAVKYSPCGSTVQLTASYDGAMIAFEIADRGPGLPDEMWPRLFKPFQQAESPLVDGYVGTGLGLAVCKRLVEAQAGTIAARPHEGGGLIVRFTLPASLDAGSNGLLHPSGVRAPIAR